LVAGEVHLAVHADGRRREALAGRFAAALLPEALAGPGVVAADDAGDVVHHVEVAAISQRAGDERRTLGGLPDEVFLGDVSLGAARVDGQRRAGPAGAAEQQVVADGRRGDDLEQVAGAGPQHLAALGV